VIVDALWQAMRGGELYVLPVQASMRDLGRSRLNALGAALERAVPVDDPPRDGRSVMLDYFARLDGPEPTSALDLLADDVRFCFARPDGTIEGGRDELAGYIAVRPHLAHRIDHHAVDGRIELAAGQSTDGDTELGAFVTAMRIDAQGRIAQYLASFHPDTRLEADD
jgi:hypothetical protein